MIFAKLADLVVKRHAIVIVIWLILLLCALPFILNMGDVIAYQETDFVDNSYESQQAANIINERFPSDSANSSMVIVILDENLTTAESRDLVLQLQDDIANASGINYLESTTSIYDIYVMALESTIGPLAENMSLAEEQTNQSLQMFYGVPDNYAYSYEMIIANSAQLMGIPENYSLSYEGINQTSAWVFGIPCYYYYNNWLVNGHDNDSAYIATKTYVGMMIAGMDPMYQGLIGGYYEAFAGYWNATLNVTLSIDQAVQTIVAGLTPASNLEEFQFKVMLWTVHGNLTIADFMNPISQSNATYSMLFDSMAPMMTNDTINATLMGMLGVTDGTWKASFSVNPSWNASDRLANVTSQIDVGFKLFVSDMSKSLIQQNMGAFMSDPTVALFINPILNVTYVIWDESINTTPSMPTDARLAACIGPMHENYTDVILGMSALPQEQMALMAQLTVTAGNFGLSNYTDYSVLHNFTLKMIGEQAEITNMTFLQEIFDLGPNASAANISALAWKVVREGTVDAYPISLPAGVTKSFIGQAGDSMLLMVSFSKNSGYMEADGSKPIEDNVPIVRGVTRDTEQDNPGMTIYVTGEVALSADLSHMADNDLQLIEPITISLVLILMGIFFRSVMGPIIPLSSIGLALGVSQAAVFLIGTYVAQVHYIVPIMLIAILFGVGTDYSIFILARYREELLKGAERSDAMRTSITWAGESIATSGATVIISFSAISLSSFSMLTTMGLVLSVAVLIALLIALTLVPSIALMFKGKIFWPLSGEKWIRFREIYLRKRVERRGGYFRKAAKFSTKHAVPIFVAAILISIPATYYYTTGTTSFDFINGMGATESVEGLNAMSDTFGSGLVSPTQIVIVFDENVTHSDGTYNSSYYGTIENMSANILADNGNVIEVDSLSRPNGVYVDYANISSLSPSKQMSLLMEMAGYVGNDNRTVIIKAIYREEALTSLSMDTTRAIRAQLAEPSSDPNLEGAQILVGGESAALVDVDKVTSREFSQMEMFVIIGVFIVLLIVLGSIVLPLFAILSIGLSISWTLATTMFVFGGLLGKPVLWILPIILFVVLMGLGMDYNIFILTRVREETKKSKNHEQAIVEAVDRTGGIITACAVIMAGAFGSIMISNTTMLQEFGFALAFAVLLDAMLVRTYLTPAIMKILGPRLTWFGPKRLRRLDPNDISNERFEDKEF